MKELTSESIRLALRHFGKGGQEISHAMLFDALGLTEEGDKARLRNRINDMARMGEVVKIRPGAYTYNFSYRPRESRALPAIWRFVRKAKPGWCLKECALMVRVHYTHVLRYATWLEENGYIRRVGRNEKSAVTYRATSKADMTPETPYPPYKETDPFQKERAAAATGALLRRTPRAQRLPSYVLARHGEKDLRLVSPYFLHQSVIFPVP